MSRKLTLGIATGFFVLFASGAFGQPNPSQCNPNVGRASSRNRCLIEIVHSLNSRVSSLEAELSNAKQGADLSAYMRRSELDAVLTGYVKYSSPLAINLAAEPASNQQNGRCLEGYVGEVGVVGHNPCNFEEKQGLKWQLLPALRTEVGNR